MIRYEPCRLAQRCVEPCHKRIAVVLYVKLEAFGREHRRASSRQASRRGEAHRRLPKQEDAAGSPFGLTRYPKPGLITTDEEERNRLAQHAGARPAREFVYRARCNGHRLTSIEGRLFGFDDEANAATWRTVNAEVCGRLGHDCGRVCAGRQRPACLGAVALLRRSRRHRSMSRLERRTVTAGTARLVRSTKC